MGIIIEASLAHHTINPHCPLIKQGKSAGGSFNDYCQLWLWLGGCGEVLPLPRSAGAPAAGAVPGGSAMRRLMIFVAVSS